MYMYIGICICLATFTQSFSNPATVWGDLLFKSVQLSLKLKLKLKKSRIKEKAI